MSLKGSNQLIGDWIRNETELEIAKTYSEKRIGEFNTEDMKGLVEVMGKWRFLLGVVSESSDTELVYICQFIYDEFKRFTLTDIKLAMNWAISGKTDMSYVSVRSLSANYVSKAIQAYEVLKRSIVEKIAQDKETYERHIARETPTEISIEDRIATFKEILISAFIDYKEKGSFYDFGDFIYNWIKDNKIVAVNKQIINDAMVYGETKLRKVKHDEKHDMGMRRVKIKEAGADKDEFRKKKFAREYIITKFFDKVDIEKLVSLVKREHFK